MRYKFVTEFFWLVLVEAETLLSDCCFLIQEGLNLSLKLETPNSATEPLLCSKVVRLGSIMKLCTN